MPRFLVKAARGRLIGGMAKADDDRATRLAQALRENLRRRKEQSRNARNRPAETEKDGS
jgi:hypothetical protein